MKFRLIFAAGLLALSGCATYDYTGAGSGGYYRGAPDVQYRYPPGYSRTSTATRTVCRTATVPVRSVFTTTRCIRSTAAAITIGSMIAVRSTARRALTDRSTTAHAPLIRFPNNPTGLLRPAHSRLGHRPVSGHHHGSFTRFNGKPHHATPAHRFRRPLTATRSTISDSGGLCPADDWPQAGCSV